ncbi:hypothetical protein [Psychrobacter sp. I-STPA6b]|uniref:hypothetical protein n=1 Tax=Psychrobacter sp. I-STPA6b TaxID=2585718 RepID=UPI001D0CBC23|nr:hypothetical protein [Psychrobacter sp. I-STPA6b]
MPIFHYFADGQRIASKIGKSLETPMFGNQSKQQEPAGISALPDIDTEQAQINNHYNALVKERSHGILSYRPNKIKIDLGDHSNAEDPRGIDYEGQQYFYHLSEEEVSVWGTLTRAQGESYARVIISVVQAI